MATIKVTCVHCETTDGVVKNDKAPSGLQHWLFYAWEPRYQRVIAHTFGRRTKKTLKKLLALLKPYQFRFYSTDEWKPYDTELSDQRHVVSKKLRQSIERTKLTLRTRIKRLT